MPGRRYSTSELATLLGATLIGPGDVPITHMESAEWAGEGALTFVRAPRFVPLWSASRASAAVVAREIPPGDLGSERPLLAVDDVDGAIIRAIGLFAPESPVPPAGVHPGAVVAPGARVDADASIGPGCVIAEGAAIGPGVRLVSGVYVGVGAKVGDRTLVYPGVSVLDRCEVGRECIIHAGVVIGADGFGYAPRPDGRGLAKIPHIGNVLVGDDVEIGANTCIDRAKFGSTTIGHGTKIDNLVQIAHNCRIGRSCIICGHCGIAGSVTIGDGVVIGGMAGVRDNVSIGSGAKIAAGAGVASDVPPGAVYMGTPAGPATEWRRIYGSLRRMGRRGEARPE